MRSGKNSDWSDVFVVLPTLNEEEGLALVLRDLKEMGFPTGRVIVIDGGSTDGTLEVARRYSTRIIVQEGRGKGNGFRTFLKKWKIRDGERYVMLDADHTYDPLEIPNLVEKLDRCDVVSGVRKLKITDLRSLIHAIGGFGLSLIGSLLFLRWNPDICTGYWAFRGSALRKIEIDAEGFDLEANIWTEVCTRKLRHCTVKVNYRERVGESKLNFTDGFRIAMRFLKDRFKRRSYKRP